MIKSVIKTNTELLEWFYFLKYHPSLLVVDCETTSLDYSEMGLVGISFCDGTYTCYVDIIGNPEEELILKTLRDVFSEFRGTLIFHNAAFDIKVLTKFGLFTKSKIWDTMVASHLLNENEPCGLKHLANTLLGVPLSESIEWEDATKQGSHTQKFYDYAQKDAEWTWELYKLFAPRIEKEGLGGVFDIEMSFIPCLVEMEIEGIKVDTPKLMNLRSIIDNQIKLLHIKLCQLAEIDFVLQSNLFGGEQEVLTYINFDSPLQLSKLLRDKFELALGEPNERGHCSVDKGALNRLQAHPFVQTLITYRNATALRDKFIKALPRFIQMDGRVRTSFRNTLVTGRLSSNEPNLQQIPGDNTGPLKVRECFVAEAGKTLVCADYSGQELRVLADESKDPTLIEAFKSNQDVHLTVANRFFNLGLSPQALTVDTPQYKEARTKFKKERDKIKPVNFGIIYGKTAVGFAQDWNISREKAQKFIDDYFITLPGVKTWIEGVKEELKQKGYVTTLTGRRRRFPDYKGAPRWLQSRMERQAVNMKIQSPSADMVKRALGVLLRELKQCKDWGAKLILQVHDEFLVEVNTRYAQAVKQLIQQVIPNNIPWKSIIPYTIEVGMGLTYSESKP